MVRRANTFRIDYAMLPKKPDSLKVQNFIGTVLGLKPCEVLRIQLSRSLGCAFVKVVNLELAQKVCEEHDRKHEVTGDGGKKIPLRITMEDGGVEVKMYDLSEATTDAAIAQFLSQYGDVMSVQEEQYGPDQPFANSSTGIRIAKMIVKHNIESWVTIDGEMTLSSYFGQRQTCRHCRDFFHIGATCVQNKKLQIQKSYADATKQPAATSAKANPRTQVPRPQVPKPAVSSQSSTIRQVRPPKMQNQHRKPSPPPPPPPATIDTQSIAEFPQLTVPIKPISGSMPPSDSGSLIPSTGRPPPASGNAVGKTASGKSDGHETDDSVASTASSQRSTRGRPAGKKPRREPSDDEREEN